MEEPFGAGAFGIWSSTRLNGVHRLPPSKEGSTIYMIADEKSITFAGRILKIYEKFLADIQSEYINGKICRFLPYHSGLGRLFAPRRQERKKIIKKIAIRNLFENCYVPRSGALPHLPYSS
jgi:hypothetical protein